MKLQLRNVGILWNPTDLRASTYGSPMLNPGREDQDSWGNPFLQLSPQLGEWDESKGMATVVPIEHLAKLAPDLFGRRKPQNVVWDSMVSLATAVANHGEPVTLLQDDGSEVTYSAADVAKYIRASVPDVDSITHVAIAAQRRRVAMPLGLVHAGKDVSHVPKAVIHCQVKQHETYADLLDDILAENNESGRLAYSDASIMHLACMIVGLRPLITEVQLMRRLGFAPDVKGAKGKAQKFLRWAKVAAKFPNLKIGERVLLKPVLDGDKKPVYVKGGYLPVARFDKELPQAILGIADAKGNHLEELFGADRPGKDRPATESQVERILQAMFGRAAAAPEVVSKKDIDAVRDNARYRLTLATVGEVLDALRKPRQFESWLLTLNPDNNLALARKIIAEAEAYAEAVAEAEAEEPLVEPPEAEATEEAEAVEATEATKAQPAGARGARKRASKRASKRSK